MPASPRRPGCSATGSSQLGHQVLLTREPGGTDVGALLRRIVLDHATGALSPRAEALIYAADKAEHVDEVVLPALAEGMVVVTDRYVDSTLAYQGAGRAVDVTELEQVARWATSDLRPHLTVVLDVDPATGLGRAGDLDRIEVEPLEFHQRVREHFLDLAARRPRPLPRPPGRRRRRQAARGHPRRRRALARAGRTGMSDLASELVGQEPVVADAA